jgi:hypothetical protein
MWRSLVPSMQAKGWQHRLSTQILHPCYDRLCTHKLSDLLIRTVFWIVSFVPLR